MKNLLDVTNKELIKETLAERQVVINFTKADGTNREMLCTCCSDLIGIVQLKNGIKEDSETTEVNENVQKIFDLNLKEWRCFVWSRLNTVEII